jgi:hypothetical protein
VRRASSSSVVACRTFVLASGAMNGLIRGAFRVLFVGTMVSVAACGHDSSSGHGEGVVTAPQGADCGHTSCGSNFFVDAVPPGDCATGANCTIGLTLVATGAYHINDEYPYKFRADDAPKVTFQGTDPTGPNVFSKGASNWQKTGAQKGTMNVIFQSTDKGTKNVSGTFKFSVCSEQNCQLEQAAVTIPVSVH